METLAAVLLQLNLFDGGCSPDHLAPLFPSEDAVGQRAVDCDGPPLLRDLVSSLKVESVLVWITYGPVKLRATGVV